MLMGQAACLFVPEADQFLLVFVHLALDAVLVMADFLEFLLVIGVLVGDDLGLALGHPDQLPLQVQLGFQIFDFLYFYLELLRHHLDFGDQIDLFVLQVQLRREADLILQHLVDFHCQTVVDLLLYLYYPWHEPHAQDLVPFPILLHQLVEFLVRHLLFDRELLQQVFELLQSPFVPGGHLGLVYDLIQAGHVVGGLWVGNLDDGGHSLVLLVLLLESDGAHTHSFRHFGLLLALLHLFFFQALLFCFLLHAELCAPALLFL